MERFLTAQEHDDDKALAELKSGRKQSHWMWYIFPQVKSLGMTEMSKRYAVKNIGEATDYLDHPVLVKRLTTPRCP